MKRLKSWLGLGALAGTSPIFPLAPALSPLIWLASSSWRRASDIAQGTYAGWWLGRRGQPFKRVAGIVGASLGAREALRAVLTERATRYSPFGR